MTARPGLGTLFKWIAARQFRGHHENLRRELERPNRFRTIGRVGRRTSPADQTRPLLHDETGGLRHSARPAAHCSHGRLALAGARYRVCLDAKARA
jgi:hypothetical protein